MATAVVTALITKDVLAVMVPTANIPTGLAPVAPIESLLKKINEEAVTAVVETVAEPPTRVTEPKEFAPAVVVVPTEVETILLPAVFNTKFPLVAVIAPDVAVRLPATIVFPVDWAMVSKLLLPRPEELDSVKISAALLSKPMVIVEAPTPEICHVMAGSPDADPPTAICT